MGDLGRRSSHMKGIEMRSEGLKMQHKERRRKGFDDVG